MRILLINYRYYSSGGPEAYMFNVKRLLEANGHEVIPYTVSSVKNISSKYSSYFPHGRDSEGQGSFSSVKKTPKNIIRLLKCTFFNWEAYHNLRRLIKKTKPEVAYVLQQVNALSPSVFKACKDEHIKVVHRISDFNMICPRFDFLRNGEVCTECLYKGPMQALKYNCCHESKLITLIRVMSMLFHNALKLFENVDVFICPTNYTAIMLIKSGIPKNKVFVVPTFAPKPKSTSSGGHKVLYLGRISPEKGLDYLLDSIKELEQTALIITGATQGSYYEKLKERVKLLNNPERIEFTGFIEGDIKEGLFNDAFCVVCPSICVENMPNAVLEAYSHGLPVVVFDVGCMSELVKNGETGFIVPLKDSHNMAIRISQLFENKYSSHQMGINGKNFYKENYNEEKHLNEIISIFSM